jgi:cytochrome c-L
LFTTPEAKEFLATGKNPYVGNTDAIAKGKKVFQLYSCTQCHGPEAQGQVGPGLTGPDYRYPKDATNKGMFETIWHGTNGGMGAKGKGLMDPSDPTNGLTVDETLQIIAWVRSHSKLTGNE